MINGTIQTIHPITEFESKGGEKFTKQIFTVVNSEGFEGKEQLYAFELFGEDKTALLKKYKVGDSVSVDYNLNCRFWKDDRYFVSLQAWKIAKDMGAESDGIAPPTLPEPDSMPF
tara:strand:+ start:1042 stop:1386 length:345 start_codon:yes stop_codon:yes gene_type:complete